MFQVLNPHCRQAKARRLVGYFAVLAALILTTLLPGAFAQVTHVANPYVGATVYASPDYKAEVATAVATETAGSPLANQMTVVGNTPTFVWLDRIAAIAGGSVNSNRLGLQGHITAALAQQSGSTPVVVQIVIYDLPDRDCAALASNGELSIAGGDIPKGYTTALTGTGLQEYENDYITPIYNIMAAYKTNPNIRFVLVVEDDSLPNIVTNTGYSYSLPNCVAANGGSSYPTYSMTGVYVEAIQYALNQFHSLPNAYNYLDIGHHGWLGWTEGAGLAFPFYANVAKGTTAGFASIDGIITNTANYGPTKEPYMTATEAVGSGEVYEATFYSYDPSIDEISYAQEFYTGLTAAGFPSTLGFLIDTSRNGWGGSTRPTGASTSTDLNTFVNATKIDGRDDMGQWCNQPNQGIGALPAANPGGFANLQAYVWVKPPGESDGNYPGSVYNGVTSTVGDPNCDPAHDNALANGFATNAIPNSPSAGTFWLTEFLEDVQNAYPALPTTTSPGFTVNTTATSVMQGTSVGSGVTVSAFNGFNSAVTLAVTSTLPSGVTAVFSPTSVTGSGGSTLTFTATNTATVGAVTVTVTGTSGSTVETATLALTVTARPEFTISVSPATLSLPPNTNPTVTLTVTYVGGLTGSVALSASGLPSGVQANFAPSSLNSPGGTIVVNFNSQTSTPSGTYNILLTGTDGTLVNSATLALTIPPSGFTLAPSATTVALTQGKTATDTITVTDVGSFTGNVTLAATGLPSGVTAAWGTNPTTGSSVLTLTATSTATTGSSTVTVTGTSGSTTATTTFTLNVSSASGFTLAPSASTLSVAQGKTATDTITVTDVGGFTGSVTLAATGLPTGVTVAYGTNPTTATSVLTFTATSTATIGTSTVTITGTSGTTTATTTISLTVTGSGFTIAPSASTLSVAQGKTATDTITVTDTGGFTGSVTLAATGLPSGVTVAYGTNPTTATSVLTFTASATATAGTSTVTITGTSGTTTATTTISLTVTGTGFTLAPSASTLSVTQAKTATDTITVTDTGGFTGSVTLVATGLPSGVTVAYGTNPTTATSVLTFTASATATAGTSTVTITGTSGTTTAKTTIALTVVPATSGGCTVDYVISPQNTSAFGATITIINGSTAVTSWTLTWTFANGQTVASLWNGIETQSGAVVTVKNEPYNGTIAAGGTLSGIGFNGTWNGTTNAIPTAISLNGTACTVN
jgi:cellulose 1,4-beta-cellobiosidase